MVVLGEAVQGAPSLCSPSGEGAMTQVGLPGAGGFWEHSSLLYGALSWVLVVVCVWLISLCRLQPRELRSYGEEEVSVDK